MNESDVDNYEKRYIKMVLVGTCVFYLRGERSW
jgi:hypothetical protein